MMLVGDGLEPRVAVWRASKRESPLTIKCGVVFESDWRRVVLADGSCVLDMRVPFVQRWLWKLQPLFVELFLARLL